MPPMIRHLGVGDKMYPPSHFAHLYCKHPPLF